MLTLERFIKGIIDGHNLFVGIPIMTLTVVTILCLPFSFDYAIKSIDNMLYIIRILVIWYNIMYLLVLYYNSTLPACQRGRTRNPRGTYVTPEAISRIFRTMTIDIRIPPPGDNIVINNVNDENVHDSGVQNGVSESVQRLKDETPLDISEADTVKGIKIYIFDEYKGSADNKELAYCALRQIDRINSPITRLGMNERAVLQLVWNRFHQPVNRNHLENLRSNLILELADSMKNVDNARCPTGRVNRIIQSLELADAEPVVTLKTESMMEEEIRYLISPLRQRYLETLSQEERDKYESGTDAPEMIQAMKQCVDGELRKKYVETGLLTEEKYQNISTMLLSGLD